MDAPRIGQIRDAWVRSFIEEGNLAGRYFKGEELAEIHEAFDSTLRAELARAWREGFIANSVEVINGLGLNKKAYAQAMERLGAAADARNPYRAAEKIQEG